MTYIASLESFVPQSDLRARLTRLLDGKRVSLDQVQVANDLTEVHKAAGFVSGEVFCALVSLSELGKLKATDEGEVLIVKINQRLQEMLEVFVW